MDNISLFFLIFGFSKGSPFWDNLMIFGAEYLIYLSIILMFVFAMSGGVKEKKACLLSLISLALVVIIIKVIHLFILEERPFVTFDISPLIPHQEDPSFPSRHTSAISAIAFAFLFYKSKWALVFGFFVFWIGVARVYTGVHYPGDVLGGIVVGAISVIMARQIIKFLLKFF